MLVTRHVQRLRGEVIASSSKRWPQGGAPGGDRSSSTSQTPASGYDSEHLNRLSHTHISTSPRDQQVGCDPEPRVIRFQKRGGSQRHRSKSSLKKTTWRDPRAAAVETNYLGSAKQKHAATLPKGSSEAVTGVTTILGRLRNLQFDPRNKAAQSVSVFSRSRSDTLSDLIEQLPPTAVPAFPRGGLYVILVTPSFAADLDAAGNVLAKALSRLAASAENSIVQIEVLVAVVDKLPSSTGMQLAADNGGHDTSTFEGISVASTAASHLQIGAAGTSNWSTDSSRFTHSLEPEKPATITFSIHAEASAIASRFMSPDAPKGDMEDSLKSYTIQVPLPSTLFRNGRQHTLLHGKFVRDEQSRSWQQEGVRELKHASVLLPFSSFTDIGQTLRLHLPLMRLTEPQPVVSCMGNIIRELGGPIRDAPNKAGPASAKLEKAVADYFKHTGIPPQTMSVWALIVPRYLREASQRQQSGDGEPADEQLEAKASRLQPYLDPSRSDRRSHWKQKHAPWMGQHKFRPLIDLFGSGVRLVRVTSGGGGWGNKAGLLSLDPDVFIDEAAESSSFENALAGLGLQDGPSGLKSIASEGDLIQFLFVPLDRDVEAAARRLVTSKDYHGRANFELGVIPSSIDDEEEIEAGIGEKSAPLVTLNHFGALTERSLALRIDEIYPEGSSFSTRSYETKVDVPFCRFITSKMVDSQAFQGHTPREHAESRPVVTTGPLAADAEPANATSSVSDAASDGVIDGVGAKLRSSEEVFGVQPPDEYTEVFGVLDSLLGKQDAAPSGEDPAKKEGGAQPLNFQPTKPREYMMPCASGHQKMRKWPWSTPLRATISSALGLQTLRQSSSQDIWHDRPWQEEDATSEFNLRRMRLVSNRRKMDRQQQPSAEVDRPAFRRLRVNRTDQAIASQDAEASDASSFSIRKSFAMDVNDSPSSLNQPGNRIHIRIHDRARDAVEMREEWTRRVEARKARERKQIRDGAAHMAPVQPAEEHFSTAAEASAGPFAVPIRSVKTKEASDKPATAAIDTDPVKSPPIRKFITTDQPIAPRPLPTSSFVIRRLSDSKRRIRVRQLPQHLSELTPLSDEERQARILSRMATARPHITSNKRRMALQAAGLRVAPRKISSKLVITRVKSEDQTAHRLRLRMSKRLSRRAERIRKTSVLRVRKHNAFLGGMKESAKETERVNEAAPLRGVMMDFLAGNVGEEGLVAALEKSRKNAPPEREDQQMHREVVSRGEDGLDGGSDTATQPDNLEVLDPQDALSVFEGEEVGTSGRKRKSKAACRAVEQTPSSDQSSWEERKKRGGMLSAMVREFIKA